MVDVQAKDADEGKVDYKTRYQELPAFDLTGFTKIVKPGGELYCEVRSDGRWEALRAFAAEDNTIFGVASLDRECPKGSYRYTLRVKTTAESAKDLRLDEELFSIHIQQAGWLIFQLEDSEKQYVKFWRDDPYRLVKQLGWVFDSIVGLHIGAYPDSYVSDHDGMEFMMPVKRLPKE